MSENFIPGRKPRIALVASIAWTLWNYRLSLIIALENAGFEVILLAAEDASCTRLRQHTRATFVPLRQMRRSSLSPIQNLLLTRELYQHFRHYKPDLILLFTIRPNTLGNLAAAVHNIPTLSTIEGMGIAGSGKRWLQFISTHLYRFSLKFSKAVVFLNRDDHREFLQHRLVAPENAVVIHGPGVDLLHFSPRPARNQQPVTFLFVARLLAEKGIREFVEAAAAVQKLGRHARFKILGEPDPGNPTSIKQEEIDQWVRTGVVEYLGFHDDVRPFLAEADVLVLPSYYREGVPRSILEAMSMEKVILTTDNVGCRDTVKAPENGLLVPPRNVPALTEAMIHLLETPAEIRREMGRQGRRLVQKEFGDDRVIPKYLALIRANLPSIAYTASQPMPG